MKKTALIALMIVALTFGAISLAFADVQNVAVSAKVNPKFEMTISQPAITFDGVDVGFSGSQSSVVTVKSNKLWDFSKETVSIDALLAPVLTESTDVAPGTGKARGVTDVTATYTLDLTTDAAYDLEANTPYSAAYKYTAVQQ